MRRNHMENTRTWCKHTWKTKYSELEKLKWKTQILIHQNERGTQWDTGEEHHGKAGNHRTKEENKRGEDHNTKTISHTHTQGSEWRARTSPSFLHSQFVSFHFVDLEDI